MTPGWQQTTLGQCVRFISGGTPSKSNPSYWGGSIPWISAKDMKAYVLHSAEDCITAAAVNDGAKTVPPGVPLILVRGMTLHNDVPIVVCTKPASFNQDVKAVVPKEGVEEAIVPYLLLALKQNLLASVDSASHGTGRLLSGTLESLPVTLPPPGMQKELAAFFKSIDDKIDLNRRTNETLEAMARAVFKSWFVDFDPVHAKAAGKVPAHMDAGTASLFPDAFGEAGLPLGWQPGTLSQIAENPRRGVSPEDCDESTPYIGLEHMPRKSISLEEWELAGKVTSTKTRFEAGEYLFGKLRPYFHKVGIAPTSGICSTDILVVKPKMAAWSGFILSCISSDEFVAYTDQTSSGTKMPRTNWRDMGKFDLVLPSEKVAEAFNSLSEPMLAKIVSNIHENQTLAALRDLLLPRLMSGELRLRDAEKIVEGAA